MVEHIVHIDGVTGSSPVATTRRPSATWLRALFISRRPGGKGGGSLAWPSRAYFVGLLWPRALGNSVVEPGFMPGAFFSFRRTRGLAGPPEGRKTAAADKPRGLPGMRGRRGARTGTGAGPGRHHSSPSCPAPSRPSRRSRPPRYPSAASGRKPWNPESSLKASRENHSRSLAQ